MKTRKLIITTSLVLLISLLLAFGFSGCGTSEPAEGIKDHQESLSTTQTGLHAVLEIPERLPLGEKVNLKFTLKNGTDSPLYVLNWYTPLEGIGGEIFRVTYEGEPIPYEGIMASRATPTEEAYVFLNPGESVSAVVDLTPSYAFDRAGVYMIEFLSPRISHIAHSEDEMASTMEALGPVEIPSNPVYVELVDDIPGEGLPQLRSPEDAQELIESHLRNQGLELGIEPILPVEELHFEDLWSALRAQVFRVSGGKFLNDTFLLKGADVVRLGAGLSDQGNISINSYADDIVEFALTAPAFLELLQASPIPVNCITPLTADPQTPDMREELLACKALYAYFHHLHAREYEQAMEYYGGSYDNMRNHNPSLDPDDYVGLFKNACTENGAQCLEIQKATFIGQPSPSEYRFSVQFANEDGSTFGRGACCGDESPNQSVQYAFTYTLRLEPTGKYLVLDMPVYSP